MKKLLSIFAVLLVLTCAFVACDKTETPNTNGDNDQTPHTHIYGEWSVTTAATCGTKGEETRVCSCGASETREIAATGAHTYGAWSVITAPSCTTVGEEIRFCACAVAYEVRKIQATGVHTSGSDGFCLNCDKPLTPTDGVIYDLADGGTYAMVLGYSGEANRVIIADTYMNKPVKEIYKDAFKNTTITAVAIPTSVTSIGFDAFYECSLLTSVTFDDIENSQLTSIGSDAFYHCKSLTSIKIPASATSIGSDAFYRCTSLTSVTFDDIENSQLTSIGSYAFHNCVSLMSIEIPASVTVIDEAVFQNCTSLTSATFTDGFAGRVGASVFHNCSKLITTKYGNCTYIKSNNNPYFLLYSCDNKNLSTYQIHEDTKIIAAMAFYDCSRLSTITIPASVTSIGTSAFADCTSLTSITFAETSGWWARDYWDENDKFTVPAVALAAPVTAATYLKSTYSRYYWKRIEE